MCLCKDDNARYISIATIFFARPSFGIQLRTRRKIISDGALSLILNFIRYILKRGSHMSAQWPCQHLYSNILERGGKCRLLPCKSHFTTVEHRVETFFLPEFRQTKLLRVWQGLWLALGFTMEFWVIRINYR